MNQNLLEANDNKHSFGSFIFGGKTEIAFSYSGNKVTVQVYSINYKVTYDQSKCLLNSSFSKYHLVLNTSVNSITKICKTRCQLFID